MRRRKRPTPADLGLTAAEGRILTSLRTPQRVQEYVTALPANFEHGGDCLRSVRGVLRHREAHCLEAAFVAAYAPLFTFATSNTKQLVTTREGLQRYLGVGCATQPPFGKNRERRLE